MKNKETLEKISEKLTKDFPHYSVRENMDDFDIKGWFLEALQKGAEWQAERMYSEEEVEIIIQELMNDVHCGNLCYGDNVIDFKLSPRQWFKQYKKK